MSFHAKELFFTENDKKKSDDLNQVKSRFGSFYLRVGAVAFGIGSMVYSGLEFGQYFELKGDQRFKSSFKIQLN